MPCRLILAAMVAAIWLCDIRIRTPQAAGRPPRQEPLPQPGHGPAGTSSWEDVLFREIGHGTFEDFVLHLEPTNLAPQLGQLVAVGGGDTGLFPVIDPRLPDLVRDRGRGDAELFGQGIHRYPAGSIHFHRSLSELARVGFILRHQDSNPRAVARR